MDVTTKSELLERWRAIEEEEEEEDDRHFDDSSKLSHIQRLKERWFSDAFNILSSLPKSSHIWCGYWEIMGPLLETFYNYFKVDSSDSPLKILWQRLSREMLGCTQCISQHHRAQDMYRKDYESTAVSPLLSIIQCLDEERVSSHLKEFNARIEGGEYDPEFENTAVVSLVFEVLGFPVLLDDKSVASEFQAFIEAVDNAHELALAKQQRFPGVYALLFSKSRRSRSIGLRLAGSVEKIRCEADLEPLQPLLRKYISFLASDLILSGNEVSRPRSELDRMTVWIGIKALLGFLEPAALEEGILEEYPIFLNFVLDHISDDSPEFSHAVNCMKQLFEVLGCKLWLRTPLPPSVICNSLLSQCFHTRNEKTHKDIFDLFYPLLVSLEALQDGELEKQRRHFLYFLLHQVTRSSNFSDLMRKKACQIALLIVHRGYKMNPPCPPSECAHMWGPSLVSFLKDSTLHSSLRQPALDLIQTITVSDAAALIFSTTHIQNNDSLELCEETADFFPRCPLVSDENEKYASCWNMFKVQSDNIRQEYAEWLCVPMLWLDVLVHIDPSNFPMEFTNAVVWSLSRFSMVEPENNADISLPVRCWLSSSASEVTAYLDWRSPTGYDDCADGKESKNSARVSTILIPLIKAFRRFAVHYTAKVEQLELWRRGTWEPLMSESLILLIVDPNDNVRQFGRRILEHTSNMKGLASGLRFLCSSTDSLSATFLGIRHALMLVQLDSVLANFQRLHHFFFVLYKVFKEGFPPEQNLSEQSYHEVTKKFHSEGGFLVQPTFKSLPAYDNGDVLIVLKSHWKNFTTELSKVAWPSLKMSLLKGKTSIDYKISQMTNVRVLELLPVVIHELAASSVLSGKPKNKYEDNFEFSWLLDLAEWGKSSLQIIVRYWKQSVASLLNILKPLCTEKSLEIVLDMEKAITCDAVSVETLVRQVSQLSLSLSSEQTQDIDKSRVGPGASFSKMLASNWKHTPLDVESFPPDDVDQQIQGSRKLEGVKDTDKLVILSDDESTSSELPHANTLDSRADDRSFEDAIGEKCLPEVGTSEKASEASKKIIITKDVRSKSQSSGSSEASYIKKNLRELRTSRKSSEALKKRVAGDFVTSTGKLDESCSAGFVKEDEVTKIKHNVSTKAPVAKDVLVKALVADAEDDPLEHALRTAGRNLLTVPKQSLRVSKRQVIQLSVPVDKTPGYSHKQEIGSRRFKPPRFDDWFRRILVLDYFAIVGLAYANEDETKSFCELNKVPVSFGTPEQYVEIFRPLVLEEFKAQICSSYQELSSLEEMFVGSLSLVSIERIDDFHLVRCVHDDKSSSASVTCSENDLILLTKQPLQSSTQSIHMLGKVEKREKDNKRRMNILVIRVYIQGGCLRLNRARKLLLERSKWFFSRIMNITPHLREFQALSSISVIPACPVILRPASLAYSHKQSSSMDLSKLPQPMRKLLQSTFNDSQIKAINAVTEPSDSKNDVGLYLVQGPPGTGKTRMIVAIISAFLALSFPSLNVAESKMKPGINSRTTVSQNVAIARAWQDAALAKQLVMETDADIRSTKTSTRKRVLVCAQSNAAVDELVSRLACDGIYDVAGKMCKPYIVRVGNAKSVHSNSLPFFIDTLVEHRLTQERMKTNCGKNIEGDSLPTLRSSLEKIADQIRFLESKRANLKEEGSDVKVGNSNDLCEMGGSKGQSEMELGAKLRNLYERKKEIYMKLAKAQAEEKRKDEEVKALRIKLRRSILREAEIVATTLSGCGGDLYAVCSESASGSKMGYTCEQNLFDAVIIDEAAQALEPATLIPLQLLKSSGTKCIMVGDPKQLPATVLSNVASKYLYECSMFERLQRAGQPVIMLTKQYRMHPEISSFPSAHFYEGKLQNGASLSSKSAPFHETMCLGPYVFYDVSDGQQMYGKNSGASSLYNEKEANVAVQILRFFKDRYPSDFSGGRIGIITPYKCQLSLLRVRLSSEFGPSVTSDMEFNTIDGFQGREVDILLLSTVRAANHHSSVPKFKSSSIGFVADVRRMNVALTRARLSLWILGSAKTLQNNLDWAALLKDAKERNLVISAKQLYKSIFKTTSGTVVVNQDHASAGVSYLENDERSSRRGKQNETPAGRTTEVKPGLINSMAPPSKRKREEKYNVSKMRDDIQGKKGEKGADTGDEAKARSDSKYKLGSSKQKKDKVEFSRGRDNPKQELRSLNKYSRSGPSNPLHQHYNSQRNRPNLTFVDEGETVYEDEKQREKPSRESDVPKSLAAKRKEQREAVDALLPSAFISTKKSETGLSSLPQKRRGGSGLKK